MAQRDCCSASSARAEAYFVVTGDCGGAPGFALVQNSYCRMHLAESKKIEKRRTPPSRAARDDDGDRRRAHLLNFSWSCWAPRLFYNSFMVYSDVKQLSCQASRRSYCLFDIAFEVPLTKVWLSTWIIRENVRVKEWLRSTTHYLQCLSFRSRLVFCISKSIPNLSIPLFAIEVQLTSPSS